MGRTRLRLTAIAAAALALTLAVACATPIAALAWTPGAPLATPFPRLAMWWPDTETQPVSAMARYDWILLGPWDDPAKAEQIKAAHPDEIVLNATNACEIDWAPDEPAGSGGNADLRAVPTQWLLTQCGATLTSDATTATTTLHVSAVATTAPGGGSIALFVAGDVVVIDGELARVTGVNAAAKTLTVQRGVVKAAAAHAAGTRVAATIAFWPGSLVLDLTAACPHAVASPSAGPETWAEYNARVGSVLATTSPAWDGMMIDRADGNESWLVGDSTARSIDPDRSNRVPASYDAFDTAWNTGLIGYELRLRGLLGDQRIMMTNWGLPDYAALNGNNFEGFPNADASSMPWHDFVFGPVEDVGGYFDWLSNARQPNLTTIETYEDDGGPSATGDGSYDNPAAKPGFKPNYRKMRYGLTTALLGDGFYSYEINTDGHGALGLLWFDEYYGAGRGKGWLGLPSGAAERPAGVSGDIWLRRFENGVSIVNATDKPLSVSLGKLYRRLLGTQAPATNSGKLAGRLTVPAHDGVLLAKPDATALARRMQAIPPAYTSLANAARRLSAKLAAQSRHGSKQHRRTAAQASLAWLQASNYGTLLSWEAGQAAATVDEYTSPSLAPLSAKMDAQAAEAITFATSAEHAYHTRTGAALLKTARSLRALPRGIFVSNR